MKRGLGQLLDTPREKKKRQESKSLDDFTRDDFTPEESKLNPLSFALFPSEDEDEQLQKWAHDARSCLADYLSERTKSTIKLPIQIVEWLKSKVTMQNIYEMMMKYPKFRGQVLESLEKIREALPPITEWEILQRAKEERAVEEIHRMHDLELEYMRYLSARDPYHYLRSLVRDPQLWTPNNLNFWKNSIAYYLSTITSDPVAQQELTWGNLLKNKSDQFALANNIVPPQALLEMIEEINDERAKVDAQIKGLTKQDDAKEACYSAWETDNEQLKELCRQRVYNYCWDRLTPEALYDPQSILSKYLKKRYVQMAGGEEL
jgi:hypothetical protein